MQVSVKACAISCFREPLEPGFVHDRGLSVYTVLVFLPVACLFPEKALNNNKLLCCPTQPITKTYLCCALQWAAFLWLALWNCETEALRMSCRTLPPQQSCVSFPFCFPLIDICHHGEHRIICIARLLLPVHAGHHATMGFCFFIQTVLKPL